MPNDSEQARRLVATVPPERLRALYQAVGSALLQCQNFEDRLAEFIVIMYDRQPQMTQEEAWQRVDDLSTNTLGRLITQLRKRANIEVATEKLLREFLGERNWLAHRLMRENGLDTFDEQRFNQLMVRLEDVARRAIHLQHEFVTLGTNTILQLTGVSQEELDAAQVDAVKKMIANGGRPRKYPEKGS